jgi:hypothetical protein
LPPIAVAVFEESVTELAIADAAPPGAPFPTPFAPLAPSNEPGTAGTTTVSA